MRITLTPPPSPPLTGANLEAAIVTRLRHYQQVCGLAVVRRANTLLARTGAVSAIEIPEPYGRAIVDRLPVPGPVIVYPDPCGSRWVLLTGPGPLSSAAAGAGAALTVMRGRILPSGTEIELPTPGAGAPSWRSRRIPTDAYRPSIAAVCEAVMAVASMGVR
ncbi:hypothetical protein FEK35_23145 [Nocardia cyriacigeorgica]|uniref:Uncharacterized protein n=1 Tax=Nocardia cyriacigeorgica TaxID=135487 RepID=A0A5R8P8E4_9NOCA|nr:hypothetical protein [Nocardia cyriacigeorgica]TLG01760.1 hypothetical protein FEK35_23145 [Nocardia cyriacigeorgica]